MMKVITLVLLIANLVVVSLTLYSQLATVEVQSSINKLMIEQVRDMRGQIQDLQARVVLLEHGSRASF